jgi:hypothetical protein
MALDGFEFDAVREIVLRLFNHPLAVAFTRPVDPSDDGAENYFKIIHRPIDLGTVCRRLDAHEYATKNDVLTDIQLVWSNAMTFNGKRTLLYHCAKTLDEKTTRWFSRMPTTADEKWALRLDKANKQFTELLSAELSLDCEIPQSQDLRLRFKDG